MADWMKAILEHGTDADVDGETGAWLARVAASDGMKAARLDAEIEAAENAGAGENIMQVLRGYNDGPCRSYADIVCMPAGQINKALAWCAVRHVVFTAAAADPVTAERILPGMKLGFDAMNTCYIPDDDALSAIVRNVPAAPLRTSKGHAVITDDGKRGFLQYLPSTMEPCDVYHAFAMYAEDPIQALKSLGFTTASQIARYALHMSNKKEYGLNVRRIIAMGELCARKGRKETDMLLDLLSQAHIGVWDDAIPLDMDTVTAMTDGLPEGFLKETASAAAGTIGMQEYTDDINVTREELRTMQGTVTNGSCTSGWKLSHFTENILMALNARNRAEGLKALHMAADVQRMICRRSAPSMELMDVVWKSNYETPLQAVRRIEHVLSYGEDGLLRWSIFMTAARTLFSSWGSVESFSAPSTMSFSAPSTMPYNQPYPEEYREYVDDGTVPEHITYRTGGTRNGEHRTVAMTAVIRRVLESMPLTMDGFLKATGRGGEYQGYNIPDMMNEKAGAPHGSNSNFSFDPTGLSPTCVGLPV